MYRTLDRGRSGGRSWLGRSAPAASHWRRGDSQSPARDAGAAAWFRWRVALCSRNNSGWTGRVTCCSAQPTAQESEGAIPGLLSPDGIVLSLRNPMRTDSRLVGKRMVRQVAMEVMID